MARVLLLDEQIAQNKRRTLWLFALVFVIVAALTFVIGWALGAPPYFTAPLALGIGLVYLLIASGASVATILKEARARPANPQVREEKLLLYAVEEMSIAAQIPMPKVYVQEDDDINAFATGRKPSEGIVCVTTGALAALDKEELQGVIAHELAHIKNYDIRVTTYAIALIGLVAMLAEIMIRSIFYGGGRRDKNAGFILIIGLVVAILAPLLSRLVYFAISRQREFLADASGAHLSRNPEGLARALEKIGARQPKPHRGDRTVASLYFDNPFRRGVRSSVWSSHPPISDRVRRLRGR